MATLLMIGEDGTRAALRSVVSRGRVFEQVVEAGDGSAGLRALLSERVDVVLCAARLPGHELSELVSARGRSPGGEHVPVAALYPASDPTRRSALLGRGASDAIADSGPPEDLAARLGLLLETKRLRDEAALKNATLARLSSIDSLTGLRSRHHGMEFLRFEFLRARRCDSGLTLVLAGVDPLKAVNDEHGQAAGDAVLRAVAQALLLLPVRATDVAARYAGGKVLLVLTHNTPEGGCVVAERWRTKVSEHPLEAPGGAKLEVTISVGVAALDGSHQGPDALLAGAERALGRAVAGGRNRIELEPKGRLDPGVALGPARRRPAEPSR